MANSAWFWQAYIMADKFPMSSLNMNVRNDEHDTIQEQRRGVWDAPRRLDEKSSLSGFFAFCRLVRRLLRRVPWCSLCSRDWQLLDPPPWRHADNLRHCDCLIWRADKNTVQSDPEIRLLHNKCNKTHEIDSIMLDCAWPVWIVDDERIWGSLKAKVSSVWNRLAVHRMLNVC